MDRMQLIRDRAKKMEEKMSEDRPDALESIVHEEKMKRRRGRPPRQSFDATAKRKPGRPKGWKPSIGISPSGRITSEGPFQKRVTVTDLVEECRRALDLAEKFYAQEMERIGK